jgi:NAD(P)-dependent dehydrogenase (short-subunit alcohol dehydrogenase family)
MIRSDRSNRSNRSDRSSRSERSERSKASGRSALITGSSGLLGSTIAHNLAMQSWAVVGVDRRPGPFTAVTASPLTEEDARSLFTHADQVIAKRVPEACAYFARRGWRLPTRIDRVYVIDRATRALGFVPRHNFGELLKEVDGESLPSPWNADLRPCA